MDSFIQKFNEEPTIKNTSEASVIEVEPRFEQIKDDLAAMFTIEVTSEASLHYEWVKDELYSKVVEGLMYDEYFALDYMANEELYKGEPLLTKDDMVKRGIRSLQDHAEKILHMYKEPRLSRIKELFIKSGIMTNKEITHTLTHH